MIQMNRASYRQYKISRKRGERDGERNGGVGRRGKEHRTGEGEYQKVLELLYAFVAVPCAVGQGVDQEGSSQTYEERAKHICEGFECWYLKV